MRKGTNRGSFDSDVPFDSSVLDDDDDGDGDSGCH